MRSSLLPTIRTALAVLCALALSAPAHAQLKAPKNAKPAKAATAPAAPASAPAAQEQIEPVPPEIAAKVEAAGLAAQGWLTLLDRRDWGTAWETAANMFRGAV